MELAFFLLNQNSMVSIICTFVKLFIFNVIRQYVVDRFVHIFGEFGFHQGLEETLCHRFMVQNCDSLVVIPKRVDFSCLEFFNCLRIVVCVTLGKKQRLN